MDKSIEVRVQGRGSSRGDEVSADASTVARCDLCGTEAEAVVSLGTGAAFACAICLRARLDALSVARYQLREATPGLPWGKVSG